MDDDLTVHCCGRIETEKVLLFVLNKADEPGQEIADFDF